MKIWHLPSVQNPRGIQLSIVDQDTQGYRARESALSWGVPKRRGDACSKEQRWVEAGEGEKFGGRSGQEKIAVARQTKNKQHATQ
ncbi:hypothetical protein NHJ13734_009572 [Beauveria thailandica]